MDPILLIAVLVLALGLGIALWGLRARDAALAAVARRLEATGPTPIELATAADRLAARTTDAETRLDRARRDVEALGELAPVGWIRFAADGRADRANAVAHAMLGVAPGRLAGRTVMEAFVDTRAEALVAAARSGGAATGELRIGAGEPRTIAVRARPATDGATWVVLEDLTELRRLQQIRAEFVDNLSHELRTPLSTVSLLAETLAREAAAPEVPDRIRERVAKIEVETGHLVQMVNELLDLARIEGGGTLSMADDVDLHGLAAASVERLRLFADRQGVELAVEAPDDLPRVRADEQRLGQVFVNLVHNAVKFSPDGGAVTVRLARDGDEVVASVEDHGIGIPRADQPRIFERFYKVDRARVRGGGTGLGLAIARHIVEGHGGRIWVRSEDGRGSTFSFAIPAAAAAAAVAEPARAATGGA